MNIHVRFVPKDAERGPIADAFIEFGSGCGIFEGMEINGCAIWKGERGLFATLPSRDYPSKTGERKRWDFIRLQSGPEWTDHDKWKLKNWLVAEYKKTLKASSEDIPF